MNYCIYKLVFTAPLHCGRGDGAVSLTNTALTLRADTFFSAICNEAAAQCGDEVVEELLSLCREGKLLLSDTFPYSDDLLYLPKPFLPLSDHASFDVKNRKSIKSMEWLPADEPYMKAYAKYLDSGEMFETKELEKDFAVFRNDVRACVRSAEEDTKPFDVGCCEFKKNCGLYGIIGYEDKSDANFVLRLLGSIGTGGIGGLASRGYGRFVLETAADEDKCVKYLKEHLNSSGTYSLLLATSLPKEEETEKALDGAWYNVIRRGGFSYSRYTETVKKQVQYYLSSGSVLKNTFAGDIYVVGENQRHKIYRYAKPLFLGVNL